MRLAGRDREGARKRPETLPVERAYIRIGDTEGMGGGSIQRPCASRHALAHQALGHEPPAHEHRVGARDGAGPQHLGPRRGISQPAKRLRGLRADPRHPRRQDRVGQRDVDRAALLVQLGEAFPVARERAIHLMGVCALPSALRINIEQHHDVARKLLLDTGREHAAAAEGDGALRAGRAEQIEHHPLLDLPKPLLAELCEQRGNRDPVPPLDLGVAVDQA